MKFIKSGRRMVAAGILVSLALASGAFAAKPAVELTLLGSYDSPVAGVGSAEIVTHDSVTQRLFTINAPAARIDAISILDPAVPSLLFSIDVTPWGGQANSVDVCNGVVAAAVEAVVKQNPGQIVFFDTSGNFLNAVPAGALPDMITFTPNCEYVLSANEGEPNSYGQPTSIDPEGSVTLVDMRNGAAAAAATQVGFGDFTAGMLDASTRIYGPNATIAQDLEPEYIAVDHNSKTAYITLQENNAVAVLDIKSATITGIFGLGFKDYLSGDNRLDASDRDTPGGPNTGVFNVRHWPVYGMYLPDAISSLKYKSQTFLVTANEGDARDYTGFSEELRGSSALLPLDQAAFAARGYPDITNGPNGLKNDDNLGRLNFTRTLGNTDGDAQFEELYTLGGRSFSIWTTDGEQVYDSRDDFEQITYAANPLFFNASNDDNVFDSRSDNKGPEPEAVTVGKAYGRSYAFIGLERVGGIMVYDVTNPYDVSFVQYINNRNFLFPFNTPQALDVGPEGIHFISANDSPTGVPMIAVANEVSGTTSVYEFVQIH